MVTRRVKGHTKTVRTGKNKVSKRVKGIKSYNRKK